MLIRRERPDDVDGVRDVVAASFADGAASGAIPVEVTLVDALRPTDEWLPALSMVAEVDGQIVGYVVCSRAWVEERRPSSASCRRSLRGVHTSRPAP